MQEARERGNEAFRKGELNAALRHYEEALTYGVAVPHVGGVGGSVGGKGPGGGGGGGQLIQCLIHSNMAAVYLLKQDHAKALDHATRSVALDPTFAKGHYRRGKALQALGKTGEAVEAYGRALQATPPSEEVVRAEVKSCLESARLVGAIKAYYGDLQKKPGVSQCVVEVKQIDGHKGKGVFAKQAVDADDTLLRERPLVSAVKYPPNHIITGKPRRRVFKTCDNCMRYVDDFDWKAYFGLMLKGIEDSKKAPNPEKPLPPDVDQFAKILVQGQNLAEAVIQKQSPAVPCPHCAGDLAKPPPVLWQSVFRAYPSLPPAESYQEVYCSESCRKEAWESHHHSLCPGQLAENQGKHFALLNLLIMYREVGYHTIAMMLRILAQKAKHQQEAKPDAVFPFDFFTTDSEEVPLPPQRVYNAEAGQFTEPTAADLEHQHNMQRQICDLMQNLFPDLTWSAYQRLQARIAMNAQQCAVPSVPREIATFLARCFPTEDLGFDLKTEGVAMYAVACSVNHSCVPNAYHAESEIDNSITLRAMKRLKKGDEVVITYLDESKGALTKSARHDALWRKFLFHCRCARCGGE